MTILLLLLATCAIAAACTLYGVVLRARNRRRLLRSMRGVTCDAPDDIGISILCTGVEDPAQLENLLSSEYTRYEVIAVLDSHRHPERFRQLAARYRMIGVEPNRTDELPVTGIRSMNRSRRRCYRRLVLIDRAHDTPEGDLRAAAAAASFDYLLPVHRGEYLLDDSILRLVAELGNYPRNELRLLRSCLGIPLTLLHREAIIAAGGFGPRALRTIPRKARKILWEPFFCPPRHRTRRIRRSSVAGLTIAGIVLASALAGHWIIIALSLSVAAVLSVTICTEQVFAEPPTSTYGHPIAWRDLCKFRH